jgi:hypothetical protein
VTEGKCSVLRFCVSYCTLNCLEQPHLFYLTMTTCFGLALTTITPQLQNFQNGAEYSAVTCTIWDHVRVVVGIAMLRLLYKLIYTLSREAASWPMVVKCKS